MIMMTEQLEIELRFSTKKIINLTERFKTKNLSDLYFKIANEKNEKGLAEIISTFAEKDGKTPFNNDLNKVYDFIDEYKKENNKSYEDIYNDIAEVINDEGFFSKKMTKEELTMLMNNPMSSINMEETMKSVVDKVATEFATNEFKGYSN
jgi:hypothetical protein